MKMEGNGKRFDDALNPDLINLAEIEPVRDPQSGSRPFDPLWALGGR